MSKKSKTWLIIAVSLIFVGAILFAGVMTALQWDFTKLSTVKYETNAYEINEKYADISIVTDTADIVFVPAEDAKSAVVCYEQKKAKHSVVVKDDTLVIELADTRKWYEHIGIGFNTPKITVCIPKGEYGALSIRSGTGDVEIAEAFHFESMDISESTGDVTNYASVSETVKIQTSTGDICVEHISAGALDLSVTTGRVTVADVTGRGAVAIRVSTGKTNVTDVRCQKVISDGSTGDLSLENVIATETLSVERSTGDVKLDGCDAAEIIVKTDTGDVRGRLLTDKVFITQTDTGRVDVPKTTAGGRCEITTDTGDIRIKIQS